MLTLCENPCYHRMFFRPSRGNPRPSVSSSHSSWRICSDNTILDQSIRYLQRPKPPVSLSIPIKPINHLPRPSQHLQTQMLPLPMPMRLRALTLCHRPAPTLGPHRKSPRHRISSLIPRVINRRRRSMRSLLPLLHLRDQTQQIRTALAAIRRAVDFCSHHFLRHAAPLGGRERERESCSAVWPA